MYYFRKVNAGHLIDTKIIFLKDDQHVLLFSNFASYRSSHMKDTRLATERRHKSVVRRKNFIKNDI